MHAGEHRSHAFRGRWADVRRGALSVLSNTGILMLVAAVHLRIWKYRPAETLFLPKTAGGAGNGEGITVTLRGPVSAGADGDTDPDLDAEVQRLQQSQSNRESASGADPEPSPEPEPETEWQAKPEVVHRRE